MMKCPVCRHRYKSVIAFSLPRVGSTTLCGHCGSILVFDTGLALREPTASELATLETIPGFNEFVAGVRDGIQKRRGQ